MKRSVALFASIVSVLASSAPSRAGFTFTGDLNPSHQATVTFDIVGGNLVATLTNNSPTGASDPTDVLTGLFFNTNNAQSGLGVSSVVMTSGSSAQYVDGSGGIVNQQNPGSNVGGEWAAGANNSGYTYAIAASGYISGSIVGGNVLQDYFNSPNTITTGTLPDGVSGGLVSGFSSPNGGLQTRAFVNNSVAITFSGFSGDGSNITGVRFQYGTDTSETSISVNNSSQNPVPAPPTALLALLGLPGFAAMVRLRRRQVAAA